MRINNKILFFLSRYRSEIETDQRVVSVPVGWERLPVTAHHTAALA